MSFEFEKALQVRDLWLRLLYTLAVNVARPVYEYWKIAIAAFLVVFAFFVYSAVEHRYNYTATASLLVSPPMYQSQVAGSEFIAPPLDIASYASLLRDADIMRKVGEEALAKHSELWKTEPSKKLLVPEALEQALTNSTQVVMKTPQTVVYSKVMGVAARADTPERAKCLLDAWIEVGIKAAQAYSLPASDVTVEFVRGEYEKAHDELVKREEVLRAQRAKWNTTLMTRTKSEKEVKVATMQTDLIAAEADAAQTEAELASLQKSLKAEPEKQTFLRAPSDDAIAIAQASGKGTIKPGTAFVDEIQNPVWVTLKQGESDHQSKLDGLKARMETLKAQIQALTDDISKLNDELVTQKLNEDQLQRDVSASKSFFDALAAQREKVAALEANAKQEGASSITLANAPVLPEKPSNFITRWARIPLGMGVALVAAIALTNILHEANRARKLQRTRSAAEMEKDKGASEV